MPSTVSTPKRIQKVCTIWTHDSSFSDEDVLFNAARFPELKLLPTSLVQIIPIRQGSTVRDFVSSGKHHKESYYQDHSTSKGRSQKDASILTIGDKGFPITGSEIETDESRAYVFVAKDASPEMKQKLPNLQISISSTIASVFGYRNRAQVLISTADEEDHSASHVELTFRDEYLARGDMWRLAISELSQRTVYKDQKLVFLGTIKATVNAIYIDGKKQKAAYFAATTKPVFRSESARYVLFIQMSKEMWDFDAEGAGEIMFNKVINGFLPELFKKWMSINAHHLVSIILFARLEYQEDQNQHPIAEGIRNQATSFRDGSQDFYRVVVSDMASNDWIRILYNLKKEFRGFLREITLFCATPPRNDSEIKFTIAGKTSTASKGNILQAINLACSQFSRDYIDRDLVRTGISVVVITAGTGVFEVDYNMLKLTTDNLMGSGIGIDLVSLSPMPLHSVPLFMYKNPRVLESTVPTAAASPENSVTDTTPRQYENILRKVPSSQSPLKTRNKSSEPKPGEWSYAMPHWVDISFWNGEVQEQAMYMRNRKSSSRSDHRDNGFHPRIKLYELQMMGLMENEMSNIQIAKLHEHPLHPWPRLRHQISGRAISQETEERIGKEEVAWMEQYDDYVFRPVEERRVLEEAARKRNEISTDDGSHLTSDAARRLDSTDNEAVVGGQPASHHPGAGYLDWKLNDKAAATPPSIGRRKSAVSLASNATVETSVSRTSKLSRQFSSGGPPKWVPPNPIATIDMAPAILTIRPPTFLKSSDELASPRSSAMSKYSRQVKAALNRSSSQTTVPIFENPSEIAKEGSRPIDIGSNRPLLKHSRDSSKELIPSSVETLKGGDVSVKKKTKEMPGTALSHLRRNFLSSSADEQSIPQTLSLTRAIAPWLVLVNPCNPKKNDREVNDQPRRWQHIFPRRQREGSMRWKSLCSPASVPLTVGYFPTAEQLAKEYHENVYLLEQDDDDELLEEAHGSREGLMRELIAFRLSHGFQLVIGDDVAEFLGSKSADLAHIFDKSYMARDGATVFMSVGNKIHQLLCGSDGKVEIRRFNRKPTAEYESLDVGQTVAYRPFIKTVIAKDYEQRDLIFKNLQPDYNWNIIDNFIAGYTDEFSDVLRYWRARFVLIPVDIPSRTNAYGQRYGQGGLAMVTEDTEEEIRLEGIRKFTQVLQRNRVLPPEESMFQAHNRRKDPNPLAIEYQTRDPSAVIAAGGESSLFADNEASTVLPSEDQTHTTKSFDLQRLAQELQAENGIKMLDRRWHWRLHYNCFVGSDLTSWLLANFNDVETREAAVEFGNKLMGKGLFQHVQKKHMFRDGNFFYQIAQDYRAPRQGSGLGWFGTRSGMRSVPSTPMSEVPRSSSIASKQPGSRPSTGSSGQPAEKSGHQQPERRKVYLSKVMRYDVDHRKKSYRPEIINLHYDRLHNPDNCYHIRIDWMNVTAKFIEDSVVSWANSVERYGLKLVELPINEACAIGEDDPFRSPYLVKLILQPPTSPSTQIYDIDSFVPYIKTDKFAYHKALLKRLSFILDIEAAANFPADVDVMYSWGKPDYNYTQYIHKTGMVLAQITDDGNFLLLANRLYNDRAATRRESGRVIAPEREFDRRIIGAISGNRRSPIVSPTVKPAQPQDVPFAAVMESLKSKTAEEIKEEVEGFCHDKFLLKEFYLEQAKPRIAEPSPQVTPVLGSSVPELMLPPRVLGREVPPGSPLAPK